MSPSTMPMVCDRRVVIDRAAGAVAVEITDSGGLGSGSDGSGFGLDGLAERIRSLGGAFAAGPRAEGGFAVRATVPEIRSGVPR